MLAERLAGFGFQATEEELVTPVAVAAQLFASAEGTGAGRGRRAGPLAGCLARPEERATHVLVADPSYGATYDDLDAAFRALRAGAELVATQVNRIARRDDGEHLDTGGWVRLLEYATGQTAKVLGKPSPAFFTAPLEALGRGPETALVVGDDLAADIGGGQSIGATTVLVRSGKGDRPQPGADAEPDAVVDSIADLPEAAPRLSGLAASRRAGAGRCGPGPGRGRHLEPGGRGRRGGSRRSGPGRRSRPRRGPCGCRWSAGPRP